MNQGYALTPRLKDRIRQAIRQGLSSRHVPRYVLQIPDIPVTINGKKVEIAVKQVISGHDVKPSATVQNPEALTYFKRFRDMESEPKDVRL